METRSGMIKNYVLARLGKSDPTGLWIDPLLDESQIGDLAIDLRLGYDILVSIVTRRPYIGIARTTNGFARSRPISSQRAANSAIDLFYPVQVVLATTL